MTNRERELDRALASSTRADDKEVESLARVADDLARSLDRPVPPQADARALFVEAVAARKRSIASSLLLPGLAVLLLLGAIAVIGRSAEPGESLYPVRKVLRSAGLATSPTTAIEREIDDAQLLVDRAEVAFERSLPGAQSLAVDALMELGRAEGYLAELDASERTGFARLIATLRDRAVALIRATNIEADDDGDSGSGDSDDDGSGSGSDETDDDASDNSGPGSDDSGSDDSDDSSSDSGSDDSDDSDDSDGSSSGSGSDDSDDDDNSGPGSND